ncbi:hypothetical protein P22_1638 [Propionispora sp. 2/2-37]|uniref:dephospho-CoA kinase n=1 Tax=Propionispora sp. 2/2-37 TaxID=1677858 RepID=UPI0006BB7A1D|nr:dephospho-CoA kinase [Propionispora sp. 2/2-37]CUH95567.1 hypothetical protein P22_1638 [Propionispora sp. 2/2-37]
MYIIGLTGGIASGKSTVSTILKENGCRIIDADRIAHQVMEEGKPVWQKIVERFGSEILLADRSINRKKLGDAVFNDSALRTWLNHVTHPAIREEINRQIAKAGQEGCSVVVLDIPLLIEAGWQEAVDELWVVYVNRENQIRRLMARSGLTREQALQRIDAQMSLEEKRNYADVLIDNNTDKETMKQYVLAAWRNLQKNTGKSL